MKISLIEFNNFRPYYGKNVIDLRTEENKNIVLIGGMNGQGKTSALVGIVWCLYGHNIGAVDKVFKNEVKGNYGRFLSKSLNWTGRDKGESQFSVKISFSDVELSDSLKKAQKSMSVDLERTYDTNSGEETFDIFVDGEPINLITEESEKASFVNDYLIPIDIARFVFFDAEKIAEIAALKAKKQAALMNKALGQVLGLNVYENLVEDLVSYENSLQKKCAPHQMTIQIKTFENEVQQNELRIEQIEEEVSDLQYRIDELENEIAAYTSQLVKRGDPSLNVDVEALKNKKQALNEELEKAREKFAEVSDFIPFAIMLPNMEEAWEHVNEEINIRDRNRESEVLKQKTKKFAEFLFNRAPFPEEDITFEQKNFYYKKAKEKLEELYATDYEEGIELEFEHNLDKSEVRHMATVIELTRRLSKDVFEKVFNDVMRAQNDYQEVEKELRRAESDNDDEIAQTLHERRAELKKERDEAVLHIGQIEGEKERLAIENERHRQKIKNLLNQVKADEKVRKQIRVVNRYVKTLKTFIETQKERKKRILEENLLEEMGRLLNKAGLVSSVEVNLIKNNYGLEVNLYNEDGKVTNPQSDMSKGEQQLYISALLKAIMRESLQDYPIFIDTPLGRLDQGHRDNMLTKYYPELSSQVVIFSTNTEIRANDFEKIKENVGRKYTLKNQNNRTKVVEGYFAN